MRRNKNYDSSFNSSFQRRKNRRSLGLGTGLPDGIIFLTKNQNSGRFWSALQWKAMVYFKAFGLFYSHLVLILYGHLVYFVSWYFFPLCTEKNLATLVGGEVG
jgi:hypothetical protein